MKQSKVRALTKRNLELTLLKVSEEKCPVLYKNLKEIVGVEQPIINK